MMASSILLGVEARLAKTDAMLLLTVVAAMGALARAYLPASARRLDDGRRLASPAMFWTALAAGMLLKGPLILMFVGLAAVALGRGRPLGALAAGAQARCPASSGARSWCCRGSSPSSDARGDSFFAESVGQDLLAKVFSGQESHGAPPGYYFVLFWLTFWPGATLAALGGAGGLARAARAGDQVPARLARAVLDRVRAGGDQAAALRAAALSGDRDPDRRRDRHARAVAPTAARSAARSGGSCFRWSSGVAGIVALAVIGRQFGLLAWPLIGAAAGHRLPGLAALRGRRRRAFAAARRRRLRS